jgi:hypothetical protein
MAQIEVKYDPTFQIEEISEPMYATSHNECDEDRPAEVQQTKITGILSPLIKVNQILILWDKVTRFELSSTGFLPELTFTFNDDLGFTKSLDQPGNDNLVLVQILPPFEDAYKKINLRFFIEDIRISGEKVTVSAKYNIPGLYQDKIKTLGKLSTYDFLDTVAKECELGLASNLDGTEDERYIYLRNTNYLNSIKNEIKKSGTEECILDAWIDLHNYVILCDMLERYNAIESEIKIWTTGTVIPDTENTGKPIEPKEEDAILSNAIGVRNTQLYITDYTVKNTAGKNMKMGTDKVLQSYYIDKCEPSSLLIQDGDVKKDTFVKTVYMGEVFGEYDYFKSEFCRSAFLQKINTNTIEVALKTPLLGLERGGKVNLEWYEANEIASVIKNENPIETNTPSESDEEEDPTTMTINKQVSGQYFIIGTKIQFKGWEEGWKYILILTRPTDQVNKYLGNEDE